MESLRRAILMLNAMAERRSLERLGRLAAVLGAKLGRSPKGVMGTLESVAGTAAFHAAETGSWVSPGSLEDGVGGPFDACDLRHWLVLARRAGIPAVPATAILVLDDAEMELLSGAVELPENAAMRRARAAIETLQGDPGDAPPVPEVDAETLYERLYAAMDGLPEGWMVRYARCGSSELKALAGAGAAGPEVPEVRFGPDLEVGPGWVRNGNRRRVNVSDTRTVKAAAEGPGVSHTFLARPWVEAARYRLADDPHRHGTQFAGKGLWPVEWRAFVEDGRVRGVSNYYGWAGDANPEDARAALAVRDMAQAIADAAAAIDAWPRFMDLEFVRAATHPSIRDDAAIQATLASLGRETVSCTLDFIETDQGLMLLEGGPPNTPFGGGHPCAFAGAGGPPLPGNRTQVDGVAFRLLPEVLLGDPRTWKDGDRDGCILTWDETLDLAHSDAPMP